MCITYVLLIFQNLNYTCLYNASQYFLLMCNSFRLRAESRKDQHHSCSSLWSRKLYQEGGKERKRRTESPSSFTASSSNSSQSPLSSQRRSREKMSQMNPRFISPPKTSFRQYVLRIIKKFTSVLLLKLLGFFVLKQLLALKV